MKTRLHTLIASERIASSKFADILGVNRSSISHLLSGRNNPSLDFLQKVLVKFPAINPDWLLLGEGTMYRAGQEKREDLQAKELFEVPSANNVVKPFNTAPINIEVEPILPIIEEIPEEEALGIEVEQVIEPKVPVNTQNGKKLSKIVFFYDDNSFETYLA